MTKALAHWQTCHLALTLMAGLATAFTEHRFFLGNPRAVRAQHFTRTRSRHMSEPRFKLRNWANQAARIPNRCGPTAKHEAGESSRASFKSDFIGAENAVQPTVFSAPAAASCRDS